MRLNDEYAGEGDSESIADLEGELKEMKRKGG